MSDPLDLARQGLSDREIERRTGIGRKRVARLRAAAGIPPWEAPAPEHGTNQRWKRGCPCEACHEARYAYKAAAYRASGAKKKAPPSPEKTAHMVAVRRQRIEEGRQAATRRYVPWTAEELAVALDYQHTAAEAAALTGRTYSAVTSARRVHRAFPGRLPYRPG